MSNRKRPYRFRKPKQLGKYQVQFDFRPGKWISTGTDDMSLAVLWAEDYIDRNLQRPDKEVTLRDFAAGFFTEDRYHTRERDRKFGHEYKPAHYQKKDGHLRNYILPAFGDWLIDSISDVAVENFLLRLKSPSGEELADNTKNNIRQTFVDVMEEARRQGLVSDNKVKDTRTFTVRAEERGTFSKEEMRTMFPEDDGQCERFWGGLMWATYFLVMRDTGFRPGEVAALQIDNYYPDLHGVYTEHSVDYRSGAIQNSIKTTRKGMKYKVGLLTEQTERFVSRLISDCRRTDRTALFVLEGGNLIRPDTSNKHFKSRIFSVIPRRGRTQYCLRHSFDTDLAGEITDEKLNELMGHTKYRKDYDHRSAERLLEQLQPVREILEKRRGDPKAPS